MHDQPLQLGTRHLYGKDNSLFGPTPRTLEQHLWVIGQSGTGKSTLLHNLALQLIQNGYGVCVIDPHGTLVDGLVQETPKRRTHEVVWIDPSDLSHAVGVNPLRPVEPDACDRVTLSVEQTFEHLWQNFWGPQSGFILRNLVGSLLDAPVELNPTLLNVYRLLTDADYQRVVRRHVRIPNVQQFWNVFLDDWPDQKRHESASPLMNKLDALTNSQSLRFSFGQVIPRFDALTAMNEGQIVLCNLSKGGMGPDASDIFGSVLVTQFELAGYERTMAGKEELERLPPFFLLIDEFQSFGAGQTFANIFSESRKSKLHLVAGHQYAGQLDREVRSAVLGNVGSAISFRVGDEDAELVAQKMGTSPRRVLGLGNHEVLARWPGGQAFKGNTIPPLHLNPRGRRVRVVAESQRRFAQSRHLLEDKLDRWGEE